MSVARSAFSMLTIGRIAYPREEDDGIAQRGQSVIYDSLISISVSIIVGK